MLIWDTETTGLPLHPKAPLSKQPKIIEWAGILISLTNGKEVDAFETLIHPGEPITEEITRITGITDADLVGAAPFVNLRDTIAAFNARAHVMVAHNLPFDRGMMEFELQRIAADLAAVQADPGPPFPWPQHGVCTVGAFRHLWGRNPKLKELFLQVTGRPLEQTHRAMGDARALLEVVQATELWKEWR